MRETWVWIVLVCLLCVSVGLFVAVHYRPPVFGTILYYENFRGYQVPIKADGKGGSYRWMKDVPWDTFTIEEKFDWARARGGWLDGEDIAEIKAKYGAR